METVSIRQVELGAGAPKICVPIVGTSEEEICRQAQDICCLPADIIEWRIDWYEGAECAADVLRIAALLRQRIGDMPLLGTFRTIKEGGEKELEKKAYEALLLQLVQSGCIDAVDVELSSGEKITASIVKRAREAGVKVVMSSHDFMKTPSYEEIISRLCRMQEKGADLSKLAVMPQSKADVWTLLRATSDMVQYHAKRPVITMSMSKLGVVSRLCAEASGSCLTFAAAEKASAPGQIEAKRMKEILDLLHQSL